MPTWLPLFPLTFPSCFSSPGVMPQQLHAAGLGTDLLHALLLHIHQVVAPCGCLRLCLHIPPCRMDLLHAQSHLLGWYKMHVPMPYSLLLPASGTTSIMPSMSTSAEVAPQEMPAQAWTV